MVARPPLGVSLILNGDGVPTNLPAGVTSVNRLNDPYLPGYALVVGAAGVMYVNSASVATGLSGNVLSFLPYRPPASPRPFGYIADPSMAVSIPSYIASGYGTVAGMLKVRADGLVRKTGIKEPQSAPVIEMTTGTSNNWVSYRYVYRDSTTGAKSNPSPESAPLITPLTSVSGQVTASEYATNMNYNTNQYEYNDYKGVPQIRTTGSVAAGTVTDYVWAYGFGLDVPITDSNGNAVSISGVTVVLNWMGQYAGTGFAENVALYYRGSILGSAKSPGTENSQSATNLTQGGASDSWGAILSPDIVNDPSFGFGVQILTEESGGSDRSFLYSFTVTVYYSTIAATGTCASSTDPQVDTIDVYRQTQGLDNFTFVLSVPNSSPSFDDNLTDLSLASNPTISYSNYEPFPSIDLPRSGTCNISDVNQEVTGISILTAGSSQTDGTYNINSTGGGGTGAIVQIVISTGVITTAEVTHRGSGYTSEPSFIVPTTAGTKGTLASSISPTVPIAPNIQWVSGDPFNIRWLPGTIILIQRPDSNSSTSYQLYNRPTDATHLVAYTSTTSSTGFITYGWPPAATGARWQIAEPDLAAEPSPVIWGPTPDNAGSFYFGLDPNNPGDLVWSLGNNFDSASDSNRMYVCSPSEKLMNGTVTSELSTVFSTERFWLIYANFSDAVAAVTGTLGKQWSLVQSASTRGLYMRYAIASQGSLIGWRAKDGIYLSQSGGPEKEISGQIYNLFPHGQPEAPSPVAIGGNTVYPPDDTKPNAQTITMVPGYLFYDYQDANGNPLTLVYDMDAKGWSVDITNPVANCHSHPVEVNQILMGCVDGTVRAFDNAGTETGTAIIATGSQNGGSPRTTKRIGGVFLRALAASAITPQFWANRYGSQITGFAPAALGMAAAEADYFTDFTAATGADVLDLACVFSFALGSGNWLKEWEPDWTQIPEQIVAWRTGMLSYGLDGWLHIPWLRFAYQSTTNVTLKLITAQGATATLTIPSSAGVPAKYFTWVPPIAGGVSMKFRMLEWVADAGGTPFIVFGADNECAIKPWGSTKGYVTLKPFRKKDESTT